MTGWSALPITWTYQILYHDFAVSIGRPEQSLSALARVASIDERWTAWRDYAQAQVCNTSRSSSQSSPCHCEVEADADSFAHLRQLSLLLCALHRGDLDDVIATSEYLVRVEQHDPPDVLDRLLGDMERYSMVQPENPWPMYVTAKVLKRQGRAQVAALMATEFDRRCQSQSCLDRRSALGLD